MKSKSIYILLLLMVPSGIIAQNKRPEGFFLSDSLEIGSHIRYSLSFIHSKDTELLFPDSSYNFKPFELIRKEYYPTRTNGNSSFDSVVYLLRSFEIQPVQKLSLPVYIVQHNDTTKLYANDDSIVLKENVKTADINIPLHDNAKYNEVETKFNYAYNSVILVLVLVILGVLYLTLGKTIVKRYRLFVLRSTHMKFLISFDKLQKDFIQSPNSENMEVALAMWKGYLGRLVNRPINTYTTTEIIALFNKDDLQDKLQIIDRSVYGGSLSGEAITALSFLKNFVNKKFQERKREITNAK